jgi:acetate kinase
VFCHAVKKTIGAYAAVLGGLDGLVFSGGIGEHAAPIRERVCAGLGFLGIELDARRNGAHASVISTGRVAVRVMATDEESEIARAVRAVLGG